MSNLFLLNSTNVVANGTNTLFTKKFQQGGYIIQEGATVSIRTIAIPYAFFNITSSYGNNSFSYTWVDGSSYTVNLADGFYTSLDINQALQLSMIANGLYLIDSALNNVYYLQIVEDVTYYGIQLLAFLVPTSLPTGFTAPANIYGSFYSNPSSITPYFTIPVTAIQNILGFNAGNYPSTNSASKYSIISNITVVATPITSIVVRCDRVNNWVNPQSDILDSFTLVNTAFGSNGLYEPKYPSNIKMTAGTFNSLSVSFYDQTGIVPIISRDPNTTITLLINSNDKESNLTIDKIYSLMKKFAMKFNILF